MTSDPNDQGYPGQQTPSTDTSDFGFMSFVAEQIANLRCHAHVVKIMKVTTTGKVEPIGRVDVQPLVKLMDGLGKTFSHGVVHNLPYFRLQGGADKAIILDPKVGDIGIAVIADRDISVVKKTSKESPPGSFRRSDMADGLFIGCFLAQAPTCYIQFTDDKKIIMSPDNGTTYIKVEAGHIELKAVRIDLNKTT